MKLISKKKREREQYQRVKSMSLIWGRQWRDDGRLWRQGFLFVVCKGMSCQKCVYSKTPFTKSIFTKSQIKGQFIIINHRSVNQKYRIGFYCNRLTSKAVTYYVGAPCMLRKWKSIIWHSFWKWKKKHKNRLQSQFVFGRHWMRQRIRMWILTHWKTSSKVSKRVSEWSLILKSIK